MDIGSLSGLSGATGQTLQKSSAKIQAVIANLLGGQRIDTSAEDVAALTIASQLQSKVSGLKAASGNLAQASSLTEVAADGVEQINEIVVQLKSLAQQAKTPTLSPADRGALNTQFQQLAAQINTIASNTRFGGKSLLDGGLSGSNALSLEGILLAEGESVEGGKLSIDSLNTIQLFEGKRLDLNSAENADKALTALTSAQASLLQTSVDIGSFQQVANFAAANIDSAVFNQTAAQSILGEADFAEGVSALSLANFQSNASTLLEVQVKRLPPSMLQLLTF